MDITNILSQWFLDQLELMPDQVLRQTAGLRTPERIIERILGEREAAEIRALLSRPLCKKDRVPTIFLPGIMGSLLASVRGLSVLLWFNPTVILNGYVNLLDLDEEGTQDRSPDVEIVPVGIEKVTYLKMILSLAGATRLYEFPYDWRKRLEWNAQLLHRAIQRWSLVTPERRFVLIGHSMGGMLARTYLALYPKEAEQHIERVIMLGSPLHGVPVAVLIFSGQTTPSKIVSKLNPHNDVISFAANLPASYQLLPPPPELFKAKRPYPVNWDLYNAREWKLPAVRQDYLNEAKRFHQLIAQADPQVEIVEIAGCHKRTLTDIWLSKESENSPEYTLVYHSSGEESGDDTVPLWSTQLEGITTYYIQEKHHFLPSNAQVIEAVLELTQGGVPSLPQKLPAPSKLIERIRPASLLQQVKELRQRIERNELRREDIDKLFFAR
ncbi:MAG: alpha/beta fold hydrolase [Anaerolineae bacterium]|nr:alpha/beta fold hydrolase [Anaerolineae bacterium]